jgi:hypothetical protein
LSRIVDDLIIYLRNSLGISGYRGLRFLHEINDFPSFYVHGGRREYAHIGGGQKLIILRADIRIYNYSDDINDIETLLRRVETSVQNYFYEEAEEFRIVEVSTDEGLLQPYGLADLKLEILYRKDK